MISLIATSVKSHYLPDWLNSFYSGIDTGLIYGNRSLPNISSNKKDKKSNEGRNLSKYYCNKESIREKQHRSYINQMEMDEIMTYTYSSDEIDALNEDITKDSDDDSLGIK